MTVYLALTKDTDWRDSPTVIFNIGSGVINTLRRRKEHPRIEGGQTIAISAITFKREDMRRYRLFLVKVLYFEVDNLSPDFLRWVRV